MPTRVLSPPTARSPIVILGATYAQVPGTYMDVSDNVAAQLCSNGWTRVAAVGPTSERPSTHPSEGANVAQAGVWYFDTDLAKLFIHDGTCWRCPATGAAFK